MYDYIRKGGMISTEILHDHALKEYKVEQKQLKSDVINLQKEIKVREQQAESINKFIQKAENM